MSDLEPPTWLDDGPPSSGALDRGGAGRQGFKPRTDGGGGNNYAPKMKPDEIAAEAEAFGEWIDSAATQSELTRVLPDYIPINTFIATAKSAVLAKPQLLRPDLRPSLLRATARAATQGLLPDGKQGALVPRYDSEAKEYLVCWQPMVWGVVRLGRLTGAIKNIRAVLVFKGEHVFFDEAEGTVDHKRDSRARAIVAAAYDTLQGGGKLNIGGFVSQIDCAYCIITAPDGSTTMRWMPAARLLLLRAASKANNGPWSGPFIDEMFLKGVILYTSKWVDLDTSSPAVGRFRDALEQDVAIDFDNLPNAAAPAVEGPTTQQAALPPPGDKLTTLEGLFAGREQREPEFVPVGNGGSSPATPAGTGEAEIPPVASPPPDRIAPSEALPGAPGRPADGAEGAAGSTGQAAPSPPEEPEPPPLPLDQRLQTVLDLIPALHDAALEKLVHGARYKRLIADLHNAGWMDEIKQLAAAIDARRKAAQ